MKSSVNKFNFQLITLAATLILVIPVSSARALTATEIMEKAHLASYYQGDDGKGFVKMRIINKKGMVRKREFTILKKDIEEGGDQLYFVHFKKPNDVRNTTFLVKKHPGKDDDRWLFIPSIRMVRRVAASDKRGSFVGSNFTYEDISGRSPALDNSRLLKETVISGSPAYLIESHPKNPGTVEYEYRRTYVSKENFLTLKELYFDRSGTTVKEYEVVEWRPVQGFPTVIKSRMSNLKRKGRTEMELSDVKFNIGLNERVFTERSLKIPPRKWIR